MGGAGRSCDLHRSIETSTVTNWSGFLLGLMAASADGKRLFTISNRWRNDIYLLDLANAGSGLPKAKRLTLEWLNSPTGWTRDGQAVLFD